MLENFSALLLVNGLLGGSIVLLTGGLLSLFVCEPVYRLRLVGVTLLCTVLAVGVSALPVMPRWSPLSSAQQEAVQNVVTLPPAKAGKQLQAPTDAFPAASAEAVFSTSPESNGESAGVFSIGDDLSSSKTAAPATVDSRAVVSQFSQPVLPPEFVPQLIQVFATGYVVCVAGLFLWWAVGVLLLIRIIRASRPADEVTLSQLREIAGDDADRVRLVVSRDVRQPVACRAYGRVIMLPESLVENGSRQELRFAIAHEWSHIERGDWWLWSLANLLRAAFLFHPTAWWLRRQVRLCQDFLADARAVERPGCRIDYAEFLTKQAAVRRQPVLAAGLGMRGRRSELYQRVLLLVKRDRPIETRCSHRWAWAVLIAFVTVGLIAGSGQIFMEQTTAAERNTESTSSGEAGKGAITNAGSGSEPSDQKPSSAGPPSGEVLSEGELQVQFEDQNESLCFQLTAVSEPGGANSRWWEPNGKPLKQTSLQRWLSAETMPARNPNVNARVFLLQFWKHDRVSVRWVIDDVATSLLSSESVEIGDRRLTTILFGGAFSEEARSATVRVGYAAGPWRTAVVLPGSAKETTLVKKSDGAVVGFEIPIPNPAASQDIRVVADVGSGEEETARLVQNKEGSLVAQFCGFEAKAVREYRLESRPFRWLKFENVCLAGGTKTACRVVRDSDGPTPKESSAPGPAPFATTDPTGPSIALAEPSREELRYDGRSFRQWRRELMTELNPSRRAEAMRAFSAFGRHGYTKEAVGAILDASRQMRRPTQNTPWEEPADLFRKAALVALMDLKPEAVVEVLAERMTTLDEENVEFISAWLGTAAAEARTSADLRKALSARLSEFLKAANTADKETKQQLLVALRQALPDEAKLK